MLGVVLVVPSLIVHLAQDCPSILVVLRTLSARLR